MREYDVDPVRQRKRRTQDVVRELGREIRGSSERHLIEGV
jgi:hypothetical protein